MNKLMQLKGVTDGHSQQIFSDCGRGPGDGALRAILQQKT